MLNNTPQIHHPNSDMQKLFDDYSVRVSKWKKLGIDRDLPTIHYIKNGNYWDQKIYDYFINKRS